MQRHAIHRIRRRHVYSIADITALFGVHKNTVRQWIRGGLCPIDSTRPILIHGSDLKRFLQDRRSSTKSPCQLNEFYCLKCRAPRMPWAGVIDVTIRTPSLFNLHAICTVCDRKIHKAAGQAQLIKMLETLSVKQVRPLHIIETLPPSLKCHFEGVTKT